MPHAGAQAREGTSPPRRSMGTGRGEPARPLLPLCEHGSGHGREVTGPTEVAGHGGCGGEAGHGAGSGGANEVVEQMLLRRMEMENDEDDEESNDASSDLLGGAATMTTCSEV